jgi:hypothetical protein
MNRWLSPLLDRAPVVPLILIAGVLVATSAWLLVSTDLVVSREMTWDLLFNLAGAWHLHNGHIAHVDFHDPVGSLYFRLTEVGFRFHGSTVSAFLVGQIIVTTVLFVAAAAASAQRLPLLPAVIFVLFMCLLVLMPTNVGELVNAFTFAMSYNAYGWAALGILSLILFLPPHRLSGVGWIDLAVGGALIVGLYYLKVTYFLAALGELTVAVLVSSHIHTHRRIWGAVGLAAFINAIAPYNWAYLGDILAAIGTGATRSDLATLLRTALANVTEFALYTAALLVSVGLWQAGRAALRLPVAVAALIIEGGAVLSQNAQLRGMPLCIVIVFLLYDQFRGRAATGGVRGLQWLLVALLVFPVAGIVNATASLASYHRGAYRDAHLFVVDHTNLRGLAVPSQTEDLLNAFSSGQVDYTLLNRTRSLSSGHQLSQFEYVQTLLEAAALFAEPEGRPGGIVLLDQVNPLPFMLGRPAPRGGSLWLDTDFPWQPAEAMFAEANYVLIPKFSTYDSVTTEATKRYSAYMTEHFPIRTETRSWILLGRRITQ